MSDGHYICDACWADLAVRWEHAPGVNPRACCLCSSLGFHRMGRLYKPDGLKCPASGAPQKKETTMASKKYTTPSVKDEKGGRKIPKPDPKKKPNNLKKAHKGEAT